MTIPADDPRAVEETLLVLRRGGVALVPTETVYALVADAENEAARERIFRLKRRPPEKKIGFFAAGIAALDEMRFTLDARARKLAASFWPGPLTMIVRDRKLGTAGIRAPEHPFLQKVLARFGGMLFQTSANFSGRPDAADAAEAAAMLAEETDLVVDGGALAAGARASTIVDLSVTPGRILRQGSLRIAEEDL